ncbi:hypothetical protein FGK63_12480 [Ruegeria sediminis]|uniref:Peptidase inhibitor I78 family protein n=1 Tax=Ruegeria sediminis TaxID=2583820 RepID=A0ABY2WVZ7_9RHOB|nr:I78 family peptidase inhibitor [Ruegeria sediminis]TMV06929.1 hypothetical protein FGK63_12480 [Ruegeria sediminis]
MYRFVLILTALAACTDTQVPVESVAAPEPAPVDLAFCKGESFANSVGQPVSTIQSSLPDKARVLGPDDIATQDYRVDRLNVFVDGSGVIQRLTCG